MTVHGTSTDIAVVPFTGELINLRETSTDRLAGMRDQLVGLEHEQRAFKRLLDEELHARLDHEATLTAHVGEWKITGKAPTRAEWDIDRLQRALVGLVNDGLISEQAAQKALEPVTEYKPRAAGLNALLKQKGPVAEAIAPCRTEVPQERRITVKRAA